MRGFFRFWYVFVVGDDWRIAAGVAAVLGAAAALVATNALDDALLEVLVVAGLVGVVVASVAGRGVAAARAGAVGVGATPRSRQAGSGSFRP